ncbi:hypothetical protein BDV26DRAFT_129825 [Aspergillus bertholletiae]|uniref:Uncharacterized protein n=1 Tax=Aspergillus bertholletiae TaxID=1226010 RepID=A0A5N7AR11_9EURO|nr:hypothetical protein BDV26DRAFT_129825 [Aspergillus bertholletiae]
MYGWVGWLGGLAWFECILQVTYLASSGIRLGYTYGLEGNRAVGRRYSAFIWLW